MFSCLCGSSLVVTSAPNGPRHHWVFDGFFVCFVIFSLFLFLISISLWERKVVTSQNSGFLRLDLPQPDVVLFDHVDISLLLNGYWWSSNCSPETRTSSVYFHVPASSSSPLHVCVNVFPSSLVSVSLCLSSAALPELSWWWWCPPLLLLRYMSDGTETMFCSGLNGSVFLSFSLLLTAACELTLRPFLSHFLV